MKQANLLRFQFQQGHELPSHVLTKSSDGNIKIKKL